MKMVRTENTIKGQKLGFLGERREQCVLTVGTTEGAATTTKRWENPPTTTQDWVPKKKFVNGSILVVHPNRRGRLLIYRVCGSKGHNYGNI